MLMPSMPLCLMRCMISSCCLDGGSAKPQNNTEKRFGFRVQFVLIKTISGESWEMCFGGCVLCGWCTSGEQARKVFSLKLHSFILDITRERTEAGWIAARLVDLLNSLIEEVTTSITYESRNFDIVTWNCIKKIAMHNFQVAIVYRLNHNANRDLRWIYEYDNRKPTDNNKTRQPLRAKVLRKLFDFRLYQANKQLKSTNQNKCSCIQSTKHQMFDTKKCLQTCLLRRRMFEIVCNSNKRFA